MTTQSTRALPWRDFLTTEERAELAHADSLKVQWLSANRSRAGIQNRAIHRAKYAHKQALHSDGAERVHAQAEGDRSRANPPPTEREGLRDEP